MGEYSYVTKEDIETFGGEQIRRKAFSKDGWLGKYLRGLKMTCIIDGTVFVHGGYQIFNFRISPEWTQKGLDFLNDETKNSLTTKTEQMWLKDGSR